MLATKTATLTELHDKLTSRLAFAPREKLDDANSVDVQVHDVMARADSMDWSFDLKRLWLTKMRYNTMVRQYVDPDALAKAVDLAGRQQGKRDRGINLMRYKVVKPRTSGRGTVRRWGSCMISVSFKRVPEPTITLHSRTSYLGYLAALDLTVAHAFAKEIGAVVGLEPGDMAFIWHLEMAQYHGFKSLAFLLMDEDLRERVESYKKGDDQPAMKISHDWLKRIERKDAEGLAYSDETYSTYCRVRRRYHTEVLGYKYARQFGDAETPAFKPLPSVMAETLDLSCLRDKDRSGDDLTDIDDDPEDQDGFDPDSFDADDAEDAA